MPPRFGRAILRRGGPLRRFRAIVLAVVVVANLIAAIPRVKLEPGEFDDPELWKSDIEFWHDLDSGFAGREKL